MPDFEIVASGWYTDETDELEFDEDEQANTEYIATNDEPNGDQPSDDEPYYPPSYGI